MARLYRPARHMRGKPAASSGGGSGGGGGNNGRGGGDEREVRNSSIGQRFAGADARHRRSGDSPALVRSGKRLLWKAHSECGDGGSGQAAVPFLARTRDHKSSAPECPASGTFSSVPR